MTKIWYIHGANATKHSFSYISQYFEPYDYEHQFIEYLTDEPLLYIIQELAAKLAAEPAPVHIISHSLGGIIAVALAQRVPDKVTSVVTMSTPFSGSGAATKALWMLPWDPFLMNASSINPIIRGVRETELTVPVYSFVTTHGGNNLMKEDNDGVVTVESQMSRKNANTLKVPFNHFEVLMSSAVCEKINEIICKSERQ